MWGRKTDRALHSYLMVCPIPCSLSCQKSSGSKENAPPQQQPADLNQGASEYYSPADPRKPAPSPMTAAAKIRSPLPPRPPLKRKLSMEASGSERGGNAALVSSADSGVKV